MRMPLRRRSLGLLAFGLASTAALGLGRPADPPPLATLVPTFVPPPEPMSQVQVAGHAEPARGEVPAVALEWTAPATAKVREAGDYTLMVRNVSPQPVQKVVVQVRVPKHAGLTKTTPAAKAIDGVMLWELGTLEPKAAKPLTLTLAPSIRGDLGCQAWVTFTGTAGLTVAVKEPKLAVEIDVSKKVPLHDPFPIMYRVRNTGDCRVDGVELFVGGTKTENRLTPSRSLEPGQTLEIGTTLQATNMRWHEYAATATGLGGVTATATAKVLVQLPRIETRISGPKEVLVGRKAKFTVTVTNAGELPLADIAAVATVPTGFRMIDARTGKPDSGLMTATCRGVSLEPGANHQFTYEAVAVQTGQARHTVAATGSRDTTASAECPTTVEGVAALRMEVVDLTDPVEKGGETTYEIRLTNTGSKADSDLQLTCSIPKEFAFVSGTGPTKGLLWVGVPFDIGDISSDSIVSFEPIAELAPQTEAVFRVKMKAIAVGDVRFKAKLTSRHLKTPVVKEESTRVYGD